MTKRINILGNGNHAGLYQRGSLVLYLFVMATMVSRRSVCDMYGRLQNDESTSRR